MRQSLDVRPSLNLLAFIDAGLKSKKVTFSEDVLDTRYSLDSGGSKIRSPDCMYWTKAYKKKALENAESCENAAIHLALQLYPDSSKEELSHYGNSIPIVIRSPKFSCAPKGSAGDVDLVVDDPAVADPQMRTFIG